MKSKILLFTISVTFLIFSCQEKTPPLQENFNFRIQYDNVQYEINSENDLKDFILETIGDENVIIETFAKEKLLDENLSEFDAITAKYSIRDVNVNLVIPLSPTAERFNKELSFAADCTMECHSQAGCGGCDQVVNEKCKRQTCSCSGGGAFGCTSSISF